MKKVILLLVLLSVLAGVTACSKEPAVRKSAGFPVGHPHHHL